MSTDRQTSREAVRPTVAPTGDDLPLFRFNLRQFLVFVSLLSLLMAAMACWHGLTALVLLLATLVVTFHVFSTALGTQLRWHANRIRILDPPPPDWTTPAERPRSATPQSRSPWHERCSTPLPWLLRWVAAASLFGALAGALLLGGTIGHRSSVAGIAVGSFSLAVVAGWFAFLGYSFYRVVRHGLHDATADHLPDHEP